MQCQCLLMWLDATKAAYTNKITRRIDAEIVSLPVQLVFPTAKRAPCSNEQHLRMHIRPWHSYHHCLSNYTKGSACACFQCKAMHSAQCAARCEQRTKAVLLHKGRCCCTMPKAAQSAMLHNARRYA
eukprot:1159405-Pelagomonas_calceolata.AAC.1